MDLLTYICYRRSYKLFSNPSLTRISDMLERLQHHEIKGEELDRATNMVVNAILYSENQSLRLELLQQTEIVDIIDMCFRDKDLEELFQGKADYNKVYLPTECHKLVRRICYLLPNSNVFSRYNCYGMGTPYQWVEKYAHSNEVDPDINSQLIQHSFAEFVPHLSDALVKIEPELVEAAFESWDADYLYTQIQYIQSLPTTNKFRKRWLTRFNDPLMHQIFFLEPECISNADDDACNVCKTKTWDSLPQEWRCIQQCVNGQRCSRQSMTMFDYCKYHSEHEKRPMSEIAFELRAAPLAFVRMVNDMIPLPDDAILMGPGAVQCFRAMSTFNRTNPIDVTHLTILSRYPPQVHSRNQWSRFNVPHVLKIYEWMEHHSNKQYEITWIQTTRNPSELVTLPSLSLLRPDQMVWINLRLQMGYVRPQELKISFHTRGETNIPFARWKYTLERMELFDFLEIAEDTIWEQAAQIVSTFSEDPSVFLRDLVEWNTLVVSYDLHEQLPLFALMLPRKQQIYYWSDVKIHKHHDPTMLWRFYPTTNEEYTNEDSFRPHQLTYVASKTILFQGRELDANSLLRKKYQFESVSLGTDIPQGCFHIVNADDAQVDEFVSEGKETNDQPYVFLQRAGTNVLAECVPRSTLVRFSQDKTHFYYECLEESMRYVSAEQLYVQVSVFGQTYVTKENFDFLLQSDNVYFMIESVPFYQLNLSTKKSLYEGDTSVEDWEEELELGALVGSRHCQAGSNKFIHMIYPVDVKDLDLGSARKKKVTLHV